MNKKFCKSFGVSILLIVCGFLATPPLYSQDRDSNATAMGSVYITEFMAAPNDHDDTRDLADKDGDKSDWIELYNDTGRVVDLSGWSLTDDEKERQKWIFPRNTRLGPGRYLTVFASGKSRTASLNQLHTNFKLKRMGEYLALIDEQDQTIFEFADGYPTQYTGISYGLDPQVTANEYSTRLRHFVNPTPGTLNTFNSGPSFSSVTHKPHQIDAEVGTPVAEGQNMIVTAVVESALPLAAVQLDYQFNFDETETISLLYQGQNTYSGIIPSASRRKGTLVRYSIRATDQNGQHSRWPVQRDAPIDSTDYVRSAHYLGTVIGYEQIGNSNALPVLHWFVEPDPVYGWEWFREALDQHRADFETLYPEPDTRPTYDAWSFKDAGTTATIFYDGQLYDNVFVRLRGKSAKNFDKKSFKFKFNRDHRFFFNGTEDPDGVFLSDEPFKELNVNTIGQDSNGKGDETYLREMLAWRAYRQAGVPYPLNFPLRLEQNGRFFSLSLFSEDINERFLERQNMSPLGTLFKLDYNDLGLRHIDTRRNIATYSNLFAAEQKMPKYGEEPRMESLSAFISAINISDDPGVSRERADVTNYLYRHVDIASVVNYLATRTVLNDWDTIRHNYWLYHDVAESGEWTILPWDKNETFPFPLDATSDREHPLFGSWALHKQGGEPPPELIFNRLIDAVFQDSSLRAMYLRRLRSVMDLLLGHPNGPNESSPLFDANIDRYAALLNTNIMELDRSRWATTFDTSDLVNYTAERRSQLYRQSNFDRLIPLGSPAPIAGIRFGSIVRPSEGSVTLPNGIDNKPNQTEIAETIDPGLEAIQQPYLTLVNCSLQSVDLSNWSIGRAEGTSVTFKPGVVLPGMLYNVEGLYVVPDVVDFREKASPLRNGYPRYVQGGFDSLLLGEEGQILYLRDAEGNEVTNSNQSASGCLGTPAVQHTYLPVILDSGEPVR